MMTMMTMMNVVTVEFSGDERGETYVVRRLGLFCIKNITKQLFLVYLLKGKDKNNFFFFYQNLVWRLLKIKFRVDFAKNCLNVHVNISCMLPFP